MINFTKQRWALFCQMLNLEVTVYRQEFNHYSWKQISNIFFKPLIFLSKICLRWEIHHILCDYKGSKVVKVTLVQALSSVQAVWTIGGVAVQLYPFMITTLEGDEGSASRPGRSLPPGKTRYPLYRRLGGPQVRSGQVRKISPPPQWDSIPGPSSP